MDEIRPILITVLIFGGSYLYYERMRPMRSLFRREAVLRDSAYGLAELRLPAGWRAAKELNEVAGIEAVDPLRGRYAMVLSEWRDNLDAAYTLEHFSQRTRDDLVSNAELLTTSEASSYTVDGCRAIQHELEVIFDRTYIKYLHTAVQGRRAYHQVVAWAPRRCYSRPAFDELLAGFQETPGEPANVRPAEVRTAVRRIGFR